MKISMNETVVVITGAGGAIGRGYALEFAARGARVVVNDLDARVADAVVEEIRAAGGEAVASYDTVSTEAGGRAICETAMDAYGSLDVLINNAGILRPGYFADLSVEDLDAVLDTHLRSSFFVTQPAWRQMQRKQYGRIVMTSSSSGMFGHQGLSNYAAAKAGIYGLTKALAYEGEKWGIKTNAVLPYADSLIAVRNPIPDMQENIEKYVSVSDLGKLGGWRRGPDVVAHLVVYLASAECEVSGEAFSALSGRFARVFVGVSDGWLADDPAALSAEAVAEHFAEIRNLAHHSTPMWLFEEYASVAKRL